MKSNPDKCHLRVSSCEKIKMEIGDFEIENSTCEKLFGVHFDNRFNFDYHISELCKKGFFDSQFKYCPLIWMCHSRTNKRKIDRLHERCLRIIYKDKQSSFKELLEK